METTLEAKKFLKGIKVYDRELDELFSNHGEYISGLMEDFANAKAKALLEEAAEKIDELYKKHDKTFKDQYESGVCNGLDYAEDIVLSLQIKQQ